MIKSHTEHVFQPQGPDKLQEITCLKTDRDHNQLFISLLPPVLYGH